MANSTTFVGPANWQEPCYYHPGLEVQRPFHSKYDNITMNFSEIPSGHSRDPTPRPFLTPSPQNLGGPCFQSRTSSKNSTEGAGSEQRKRTWWEPELDGMQVFDRRLAPTGDHDQKEKSVSFFDIVAGIFLLLRECAYWLSQSVVTVTWVVIWMVICHFLGARSDAEEADGGREPAAAHGSAAPLVEAFGGGWSELYERLDIHAAKLEEKEDDEPVGQDAETPIDVTSIAEDRRRREKAMSNYLKLAT